MSEKQLANLEGKLDSTGELGQNCQEQTAMAELKAAAHKGAAGALVAVAKSMRDQLERILEKEWDDGQFAKCKTPKAAKDWVMKTIVRASGLCDHVAAISKNQELIASGEAAALRRMTELIGKRNDTAVAQIRQLQAPDVPSDTKNPDLDGKGNPRRRPGKAPLSVPAMAAVKSAAAKKKAAKKTTKKATKKRGKSSKS